MTLPFINRPPTEQELERFRLVLSTYQDYTYQSDSEIPQITKPSFKDFIRTVIAVFSGKAIGESYYGNSFDILFQTDTDDRGCVVDCHMLMARDYREMNGHIVLSYHRRLEYHNRQRIITYKPSKLLEGLSAIDLRNSSDARELGKAWLSLVNLTQDEFVRRTQMSIEGRYYLVLAHTREGLYQLYLYSADIPDPESLTWYFSKESKVSLIADDETGRAFEWTPKIYPGPWYYLQIEKALWTSPIFRLEPPESLRHADYGIMTRDKLLKLFALEELERLIETGAKEVAFQKHLEANPWMFGSEYSRLLDIRQFFAGSQLDFAMLRAADNYLEIIEIKTPLNGKLLLIKDDSHESYYFISELSQAIGQAFKYIERIDSHRYAIEREKNVLVNGVRAKIIIGRDGDDDRRNALRRMNSHFHRVEILTYDQLVRIAKQVLRYL